MIKQRPNPFLLFFDTFYPHFLLMRHFLLSVTLSPNLCHEIQSRGYATKKKRSIHDRKVTLCLYFKISKEGKDISFLTFFFINLRFAGPQGVCVWAGGGGVGLRGST